MDIWRTPNKNGPDDAPAAFLAVDGVQLETDLDALDSRLDRLASAKTRTDRVAGWLEGRNGDGPGSEWPLPWRPDQVARDLRTCGAHLVFHDLGEEGSRLFAAKLCQRHLVCGLCAIRRSARMLRLYAPLVADAASRGNRPWLLTLTVRDGESLLERFEHLRAGQRDLHREASAWKRHLSGRGRRRQWNPLASTLGAIYAVEAKRGKNSGQWHPHAHYVALVPDWGEVDNPALSDAWKRHTGDSFITDARPFTGATQHLADAEPAELLDAIGNDLLEVVKYAVKFSGLPPADLFDAYATLRGRRLVGRIGKLHGWDLSPSFLDDPPEDEDAPYVEVVARWAADHYDVDRTTTPPPAGSSTEGGPRA